MDNLYRPIANERALLLDETLVKAEDGVERDV